MNHHVHSFNQCHTCSDSVEEYAQLCEEYLVIKSDFGNFAGLMQMSQKFDQLVSDFDGLSQNTQVQEAMQVGRLTEAKMLIQPVVLRISLTNTRIWKHTCCFN